MRCAYCVILYMCHHDILISIMTSSKSFPTLLSLWAGKPQVKVDSPHKGTVTRTFDVFVVSLKKTVEQTLDWPVFRDAMTVIWRRLNVLNSQYGGCWWPNACLVPRHLKPSWRNRTVAYLSPCIFFYQNCPVVSATLRKWQLNPMQETSFFVIA